MKSLLSLPDDDDEISFIFNKKINRIKKIPKFLYYNKFYLKYSIVLYLQLYIFKVRVKGSENV